MGKEIALLLLGGLIALSLGGSAKAISSIICTEDDGRNVQDIAPIKLGTHLTCKVQINNPGVHSVRMQVRDSGGHKIFDQTFDSRTGIASFIANKNGVWAVEADGLDSQNENLSTEIVNIEVSFMVLPESPVGVASLIASSLATFATFTLLRYHRTKRP